MPVDRRTAQNKLAWERKPVLRDIYFDLYRRMSEACVPGPVLEVGSGSGIFKEFNRDVVSTDIMMAPWLDVVADARHLPFSGKSFANLILFDVLHHIEFPVFFLREAERVLRPGGRLIMMEPAVTPVSWIFYRVFHQEPVRLRYDPFLNGTPNPQRDAFDANMAIPTLMFGRYRNQLQEVAPSLRVTSIEHTSLIAYPLSGGFKSWCLVPRAVLSPVLAFEKIIEPLLGRLAAFRMLIVAEKFVL
jgi:SAM-dependent methyltransferase